MVKAVSVRQPIHHSSFITYHYILRQFSPCYFHDAAGHEAAFVGRQQDIRRGQFFGLTGPGEGDLMAEVFDFIFGHRAGNVGRPDGTGRYAVDSNVPLAQLNRQRFGEGMNGTLGSRVIKQNRVANNADNAAGVDDGVARLKVWQRGFDHEKIPENIGFKRAPKLLFG